MVFESDKFVSLNFMLMIWCVFVLKFDLLDLSIIINICWMLIFKLN